MKVRLFCIRRKGIMAACCLLAALGIIGVVNHPAIVGAAATTRQLPIYCVQRDQKMVAISFDAAWGNVRLRQWVKGKAAAVSAAAESTR